jgi:hypothetical protein
VLTFLEPDDASVAYLKATLVLDGDGVAVYPRRGVLAMPEGARRVLVIRLELSTNPSPTLDEAQLSRTINAIDALAPPGSTPRLQLDFDAGRSVRPFYRRLLQRLRASRPPGSELSVTALGSWCVGDRWLGTTPVDYAVPMLFRMGDDGDSIRVSADGLPLPEPMCRGRVGLATDEVWAVPSDTNEVWLFHPRPWTEESWKEVRSRWFEHERSRLRYD